MALLNPEAKNPPKGEIKLANILRIMACIWKLESQIDLIPKKSIFFIEKSAK